MEMWESPAKERQDFPTFPQALLSFSFFLRLKTKNKSKTTIYQRCSESNEKIQVAHPASNPVLDSFGKQNSIHGSEGQDAIEDYSESGAKVQVLCL
jgi:hypothetical protein